MTKQEFLAMSLPFGVYAKRAYLGAYKYNPLAYLNEFEVEEDNPARECCLPILHQLSDLTKEIEHKGEKFVPIDRFLEDIVREWNMCNINYPNDTKGLYGDIIKNITSCEFWIIQKLIEWHFDISDLISKGEAIDVNELDINPYK